LIWMGVARQVGQTMDVPKCSSAYISPEAVHECVVQPCWDIWSLGCLLYQMCNRDICPLFAADRDDTLVVDVTGTDSLLALASWTEESKALKLGRMDDPLARNLVSQMLTEPPLRRPPSIAYSRIRSCLPGPTTRHARVASDAMHAQRLFRLVTARGMRMWWDRE
jgi:serine/threonine protein kinase